MAKTLKSLSPGTTLVVPGSNHNGVAPVLRKLADDHHAVGTTLLDTRDIIDLIAFDAAEPTNSNISRKNYGNNNYSLSNISQYLNSVGPSWYSRQHTHDAPPNAANVDEGHGPYDNRDGFLMAFPLEFVFRIVPTRLTTTVPNLDGGGVSTENHNVFLLSRTEVGLGNEREAEGKAIPFLASNYFRLNKEPTQQALDNTTYTSTSLATHRPWEWWLRTHYVGYDDIARTVSIDGELSYDNVYNSGIGLSPALNLPSDTLVSDTPNAEGHYEIILTPPIEKPKIKIGAEHKEVLEMYVKVGNSYKTITEAYISIDGVKKQWF